MMLTLPASLHAALFDLSKATGKPAATLVAELLGEMEPQLKDMAKMFRMVQGGKKQAALAVAESMVGRAVIYASDTTQRLLPLPKPRKGPAR